MRRIQYPYLVVGILSLLAVIAEIFFAVTDSKNVIVFSIMGIFFTLNGLAWIYLSIRKREKAK